MSRTQTPNDVIHRAIVLTGIHPANEDMPVIYLTDGLNILNDILDEWGGSGVWIPYFSELAFDLVIEKKEYSVSETVAADLKSSEIIHIQEASIIHDSQRFNLDVLTESQYHYSQSNCSMRPQSILLRNRANSSQLLFDHNPDQAYRVVLLVKQRLREVELMQTFDAVPSHYLRALTFQIAVDFAAQYGATLPPVIERRAEKLIVNLLALNSPDLTVNTSQEF